MSEDAPVNTDAAGWPDESTAYFAVRRMQTKLHGWAGADASRRFDDLFNLVYDRAFLMHAWERVSSNAGSRTAGVDRATVAWIETHVGVVVFLDGIRESLKSGGFRPVEVRQVMIPKRGSSGKLRKLGIPTVADRVVQTAVKAVLEPIFEADFLPCSYGFRPNRRTHDAIAEIHHLASEPINYEWVLEADIAACFDEIGHTPLLERLRARIKDKRVVALVRAFLKAGILTELGDREETRRDPTRRATLPAVGEHRPVSVGRTFRPAMAGTDANRLSADQTQKERPGQLAPYPLRRRFRRHGPRRKASRRGAA